MAKVLVSDSLSQEGLDVLEKAAGIDFVYKPGLSEDELAAAIVGFDGLVIRSGSKVTAKVLEAADKLRVVGRAGIGVDNVDLKAASRRGIIVMNTPTGNAVTTAEHAISLLLSIARKIPAASASMKQGQWEKKKFGGRELTGKTLGVIGLGNIGRIVADRAHGLKMNVIAFDPVLTADRAAELGIELVSLDELFGRADAITVHTPLTPQTKGLVNDAAIDKMKKGVLLVNAARGGIFEDEALLRGLEAGKIAGAAVDVFLEEPPGLTDLIKHPSVVATPHLGASTTEAQLRVAVEIAEQVAAYLTTGEIKNSVNVPAVPAEMASILEPYLVLGRRLGQFLGQVESIDPSTVEVECAGAVAQLQTAPVVNAALAGLLSGFMEGPINAVSAPSMAADRGIEVRDEKSTQAAGFSTLVTVSISSKDGKRASVSGTLAANGNPRLVRWGAAQIDAELDGHILVICNQDKPGVIGTIGTLLGDTKINVSRMQVGLDDSTGEATALWGLDSPIPGELLQKIADIRDVKRALTVKVD